MYCNDVDKVASRSRIASCSCSARGTSRRFLIFHVMAEIFREIAITIAMNCMKFKIDSA